MKKSKIDFELKQRYLDGLLSGNELEEFEKQVGADEELRQDIGLHKHIDEVFMEEEVLELRASLNDICSKANEKQIGNRFRSPVIRKLAIAASFLIIAGAAVIFISNRTSSPEKIFAQYYETFEVQGIVRAANTVQDEILLLGFQRYQEEKYLDAVKLFEQVLKNDKENMQLQLYSGISKMELEEYEKANESFSTIITDNDNFYIDHAQWYLALCYLKLNEIEMALQYFQNISDSDSYYKSLADEIIKKLS